MATPEHEAFVRAASNLRTQYHALCEHRVVQREDVGEGGLRECEGLLNRTIPTTQNEMMFAAAVQAVFGAKPLRVLRQARRLSLSFCYGPEVICRALKLSRGLFLDLEDTGYRLRRRARKTTLPAAKVADIAACVARMVPVAVSEADEGSAGEELLALLGEEDDDAAA